MAGYNNSYYRKIVQKGITGAAFNNIKKGGTTRKKQIERNQIKKKK